METKTNRDMKFLLSSTEGGIKVPAVETARKKQRKRLSGVIPTHLLIDEVGFWEETPAPEGNTVHFSYNPAHHGGFGDLRFPREERTMQNITDEELSWVSFEQLSVTNEMREVQVRRVTEEIQQEIERLLNRSRYAVRAEGLTMFREELNQMLQGYQNLGSLESYTIHMEDSGALHFEEQARLTIRLNIPCGTTIERLCISVVI